MTGLHTMIIPLLLSVIVLTNAEPFREYIKKYNPSEIVPINEENLQRNKREAFDGYFVRNLYADGSDYDSSYDADRYDGPARPTRYHYTPVVKYVEQRHKRHKFFVPNLWGWAQIENFFIYTKYYAIYNTLLIVNKYIFLY